MDEPLGRHHGIVRRIRALRRDAGRRTAEGVLLAEGPRIVWTALEAGAEIELVVYTASLLSRPRGSELIAAARARGASCHPTEDSVMDGLQDARSPQPVMAVCRRRDWASDAPLGRPGGQPPLAVVAHGIQDPGNLGGLIRTADAAAAGGCFVTGTGADPQHPRTVRGSMGSIFRLPVVRGPSPDELLDLLAERRLDVVGADASGELPYEAYDWTAPCALFLGGEGEGLGRELLGRMRHRVRIPMRPGVDSLSVGIAAGVLLFEAARRRARDFPEHRSER